MNTRQHATHGRHAAVLAALCVGLAAATAADLLAAPAEKTARQIKVMEGILDQVLLDSPNFLVFGRDNAHGLYLDEYGAVFTFDASLTSGPTKMLKKLEMLPFKFDVKSGKDGTIIEIPNPDDEGETGDEGEKGDAKDSKGSRDSKRIRTRGDSDEEDDPALLYRKGKEELIQVLLDYGDTITSLRDDQMVVIAAFLRDNSYFMDNQISRLVLKTRVRDLREHTAGRLTDDQMRSRIVQEEY